MLHRRLYLHLSALPVFMSDSDAFGFCSCFVRQDFHVALLSYCPRTISVDQADQNSQRFTYPVY